MKKLLLITLAALMILPVNFSAFAQGAAVTERSLALYIGSPLAISSGAIKALDPDNPNVAPIIYKNRTLVPVRAISEHFGSEVRYDSVKKAAVIVNGGKTYYFYIGKNYFTSIGADGSEIRHYIDTETQIRENRSMVPLRAISEQVLGLAVEYSDNIILIGGKASGLTANAALREEIRARIGQAVKITSLAQLQSIVAPKISRYAPEMEALDIKAAADFMGEAAPPSMPSKDEALPAAQEEAAPQTSGAENAADGSEAGYSSTTIQVEGVDEADIVKTDGKFIYVAAGGFVSIIKADAGTMKVADVIRMPVDAKTGERLNITELYIDKGRLVILGAMMRNDFHIMYDTKSNTTVEAANETSIAIYPPIRQGRTYTYCGVYEINADGGADLLKELQLEGSMLSSRKSGDTVYLVTNKYMYNYYPDYPAEILPMYRDSAAGDEFSSLAADKIMYYPGSTYPQYTIIAALDIRDGDQEATIEAMLGSGSTMYMNDSALYIVNEDYSSYSGAMTAITRFSIDGTKIGFTGGGKVRGTILNQFSMDEYQGNFRIATTGWANASTNSLYVLDSGLNQIGAVENLAPGERIYSVRFMGDKGYIVTFRQIDPLFVLDLADPKNPKVVGELKVPGFSNYLYPVAEDILLGVGQGTQDIYSRDERGREIVIGTRQTGIKFSLFDVSDQGKPKEIQSYVLGDSGSYSEILYNHKAITFNRDDQFVAFEATLLDGEFDGKGLAEYFNGAVVLDYDMQKGFDERGRIAYRSSVVNSGEDGYYSYVRRVCYIGDVLYYVQDGLVRSFEIDTLRPIGSTEIFQ